jgi:hypothetical protein
MFWNIKEVGTRIYPGLSSPTIKVFTRAWRWHHSKWDTNVDPILRSIGLSLERRLSLDPTQSKRLKRQLDVSQITWKSQSHTKRLMQTRGLGVGNHVYLRVSPMKGVKRFGMKGKLAPCYIGPFPILEKCGTVAYKLDLPPSLAGVHDIFHVSQLKKYLKAPMDVSFPEVIPLEADLSYPEHPIKVLNQKDHVTRHKTIKLFKIQWSNHTEEEAMWENEDFLRSHHSDFMLP